MYIKRYSIVDPGMNCLPELTFQVVQDLLPATSKGGLNIRCRIPGFR